MVETLAQYSESNGLSDNFKYSESRQSEKNGLSSVWYMWYFQLLSCHIELTL